MYFRGLPKRGVLVVGHLFGLFALFRKNTTFLKKMLPFQAAVSHYKGTVPGKSLFDS
jgi:hypothetical protein